MTALRRCALVTALRSTSLSFLNWSGDFAPRSPHDPLEMNVTGMTAVVTGASRGLGAGIARELHRLGMQLGLCARGAAALPDGERVITARLDVADAPSVDSFAARVAARFGHIDMWINNAGVLEPIRPLRDIEPAEIARHIEVNVVGVFAGSRAYVRHVRATAKPGVLINISSGAGRRAYFGWSAYCAAKAAVDRMTECIALEEGGAGLRAHAVAPGIIDTDMQATIRSTRPEDFPLVERFRQYKADNAFTTAEHVARELCALAFDPARRTDDVLIDLRS
jgi:NAD(P)-dependent dehydrogenase (short-subunit alcohol dehydrogenase family)